MTNETPRPDTIEHPSVKPGNSSYIGCQNKTFRFLPAVLAIALLLRLAFFTGYFGSDEVTYTEYALAIARGSWERSDYIGAARLGISLPVGLFVWLFGRTEFNANLWSLVCSLGEITLVYLLAKRFWNDRVAVLSSLVLAFTPLHAHYAGRLMADAPLAFFITLSFYCLFSGDRSGKPIHYLGAGLAAGFVWWIKGSVALVFILVFALYLIRERRLHTKWLIMAAGFVIMLVLNGLVFLVMENDFWKIFRLTTSGVTEYVQGPTVTTDTTFYLKLLFLDVKHTWFLGPLAAVGLLLWPRRIGQDDGLTRVALWGIGMVGAFSLFVVSLNPVLFITKQVNYSLVFLAPLALLAGYGLSRLTPRLSIIVAIALVIPLGTLGTALEQQAIQSFVANSKAALKFATEHPGHEIFSMTNATRATNYAKLFARSPTETPQIEDINWLTTDTPIARQGPDSKGFIAYAIFDRQTADWGRQGPYSRLENLPSCWTRLEDLKPQGMGLGAQAVAALVSASALLPGNLGHGVSMRLDALLQPLPATVFGIGPYTCPRALAQLPQNGK